MATNALNNDFLLNIQSVYPSLTKAEKKVADYTLQNSGAFSVHHRFGRGLPCKLDKRIPFLQGAEAAGVSGI